MEEILQSLDQKIILNDEIILNIKRNIRRNHPTADAKYRARLLSQSLNDELNAYLEGLSDIQKTEVRMSIYRLSIEQNTLNVSQRDLISGIVHSGLMKNEAFSYLSEWFETYTSHPVDNTQLMDIFTQVDPDCDLTFIETTEDADSKTLISKYFTNINSYISSFFSKIVQKKYHSLLMIMTAFILLIPVTTVIHNITSSENNYKGASFIHANTVLLSDIPSQIKLHKIVQEIHSRDKGGFPSFLCYSEINYPQIVEYLHSRNSAFTDESYLSVIESVGLEYDVHPLLLLAIIGQEQGFVPRDNPYANKILNNPFNVYSSWTQYNTDLKDSCEVAAGTIRAILDARPAGSNPFKWLNKRYAEDANWWKGVQELYYTLLAHSTD